jgi:glycosyltransferase involved in cell wall biosynthesis
MRAVGSEESLRPTVSVVMATYNRPDVLAFAVRSVLAQTFRDWELVVVGDACDDRTGAALAEFPDARIRYENLTLNYGEQSGPNNAGIQRARGSYIAFLNHDDIWFPDHLRSSLDWLHASGADLVIARGLVVLPRSGEDWVTSILGSGTGGGYDPAITEAPISTVLLKRSAAELIGPWRHAAECHSSSSQEWLFRAWRRGLALRTMPHVTVLMLHSGSRPGSYLSEDTAEHAELERLLATPDRLRIELLDHCVLGDSKPTWKRLARWLTRPVFQFLAQLGVCPLEVYARVYQGHTRGAFIDLLRKTRGLSRLPEREPTVAELHRRYAERADRD